MSAPRRAPIAGFKRNQHGGTAVEFALVIPFFLVCLMAIFQIGFCIYSQASLGRVAEEGMRHLLFLPEDETGARQVILDAIEGTALDTTALSIAIEHREKPFRHIEIRLDYLFQVLGPFPLPERIPLRATAMVPLE